MLHTQVTSGASVAWKKLWVSFTDQNQVARQYLSGVFNGSEVVPRYVPYDIVSRQDGFGLCSIDTLNPDAAGLVESNFYYYRQLIEHLVSIGYEPGVTLFGFPYDWRQSVRHPATLNRLRSLINRVSYTTKTSVDIITHSMGGLITKSYFARFGADASVSNWIAVGTPWRGGSALAYQALLVGYDLGTERPVGGLSPALAKQLELQFPSVYELLPDTHRWREFDSDGNRALPWVRYTLTSQPNEWVLAKSESELHNLFAGVNQNNRYEFVSGRVEPNPLNEMAWNHAKETHRLMAGLEAQWARAPPTDLRFTNIYGNSTNTPYGLSFPNPVSSIQALSTAAYNLDRFPYGDGTVGQTSARDPGLAADSTHILTDASVDHVGLISDPRVFYAIRRTLGLTCPAGGMWEFTLTPTPGPQRELGVGRVYNSVPSPVSARLARASDPFYAYLPQRGTFSGTIDPSCMRATGTASLVDGRVSAFFATRVLGHECRPNQVREFPYSSVREIIVVQRCEYGNWTVETYKCPPGKIIWSGHFDDPASLVCAPNTAQQTYPPHSPTSNGGGGLLQIFMGGGSILAVLMLIAIVVKAIRGWWQRRKASSTDAYQMVRLPSVTDDDIEPSTGLQVLDDEGDDPLNQVTRSAPQASAGALV